MNLLSLAYRSEGFVLHSGPKDPLPHTLPHPLMREMSGGQAKEPKGTVEGTMNGSFPTIIKATLSALLFAYNALRATKHHFQESRSKK